MALTTAGRNEVADLIIGDGTPFDASNAYIGVGNSTTAFSTGQTDLQGGSKHRELVDSAPVNATNVITFVATFESGDANFAWDEFGIFNHASAGDMLCRKVSDHGEKASGDVWTFTVAATVGIGS